jgi:hypothetical protein
VDRIRDNHELFREAMGYFGEQECISYLINFAGTVHSMIDEKFGAWQQAPLCLGEMLHAQACPVLVARKLTRKYKNVPKYVPAEVWSAICDMAEEGDDNWGKYPVTLNGHKVNLKVYLEAVFLAICIHNVDPERAFSIIHAYVKHCPNAGLPAIAAHLATRVNPPTCSAEVYEAKKKEGQEKQLIKPVGKLFEGDKKGDTGDTMKSLKSLEDKYGSKEITDEEHTMILSKAHKLLKPRKRRKAESRGGESSAEDVDAIEIEEDGENGMEIEDEGENVNEVHPKPKPRRGDRGRMKGSQVGRRGDWG